MCLDLIPILAIQWWLQACSDLLFEFQKVALKRILRNIFFKFSSNLFRKAVYIDKGWAVTFSWYWPMSLSDFTPALVWWVDFYRGFLKNKLRVRVVFSRQFYSELTFCSFEPFLWYTYNSLIFQRHLPEKNELFWYFGFNKFIFTNAVIGVRARPNLGGGGTCLPEFFSCFPEKFPDLGGQKPWILPENFFLIT